jgi:hypothetical protein
VRNSSASRLCAFASPLSVRRFARNSSSRLCVFARNLSFAPLRLCEKPFLRAFAPLRETFPSRLCAFARNLSFAPLRLCEKPFLRAFAPLRETPLRAFASLRETPLRAFASLRETFPSRLFVFARNSSSRLCEPPLYYFIPTNANNIFSLVAGSLRLGSIE